MCVVSMVGDHYNNIWKDRFPSYPTFPTTPEVSRAEFEELKRQVMEMKELLKRAKKYDEDNGEPDCELDEKIKILKKVAEIVGVDLNDVLNK